MKIKKSYTTPASETLEVKPQGMLCASTTEQVFWFLDGDSSSDWGREGYSKGTEGWSWL